MDKPWRWKMYLCIAKQVPITPLISIYVAVETCASVVWREDKQRGTALVVIWLEGESSLWHFNSCSSPRFRWAAPTHKQSQPAHPHSGDAPVLLLFFFRAVTSVWVRADEHAHPEDGCEHFIISLQFWRWLCDFVSIVFHICIKDVDD